MDRFMTKQTLEVSMLARGFARRRGNEALETVTAANEKRDALRGAEPGTEVLAV